MEILPGVHQIPIEYHHRPLKLYLILAGNESLLMDTGDAHTPDTYILPYLQSINFDPRKLTYILLTHPDIDHVGGAYAMRYAAPQVRFICGTADREQIESPENLGRFRARAHYYYHGLGPNDEQLAQFIKNAGGAGHQLQFATTFAHDGSLTLGDRILQVLHLPGHSLGHLGIYLPGDHAAIIGDAVHGTANRFADGKAAFACTYMYVDAYFGTLNKLMAMSLDKLFSCHWPDCDTRQNVEVFLELSRVYAWVAEGAILHTLNEAGAAGLTLRDLCLRAKPKLGDWPPDHDLETRSMALGHLQRLADRGLVSATTDRPTRYFIEPEWHGLR
jgi:glyoxylase-like metal-dependent hydrolase (beta-lactamase superfamily II)